jgi:hypothetical protein
MDLVEDFIKKNARAAERGRVSSKAS